MRLTLFAALVASSSALAQDAADPAPSPAEEAPTTDEAVAVEPAAEEPVVEPEPEPAPAVEEPPPSEAPADEAPEPTKKKKRKKLKASVGAGPTKLELDFGGTVQYDLRFRPIQYEYGTYYQDIPDPPTLSRNELIGKIKFGARYGKFGLKADTDFVLRAYPKVEDISDLSSYNAVTPFRFEAHDLYLYALDFAGARGLDVRIGQQKIAFGVGDQFNPTNNVNPLDLEDILLFGDQVGNLMARIDYSPAWNWQLTGVLVPIFKPALLPRTGYLAQTPDRFPYVDDIFRWNLNVEKGLAAGDFEDAQFIDETYPTVVSNVAVDLPDFSAKNMQGFFRLGATLGGVDVALSYYRGFHDVPQPVRTDTYQSREQICEFPEDVGLPPEERRGECVDGLIQNDVTLSYPRIHVVGLNIAGEAGIGYRLEAGLYIPESNVENPVFQDDIRFGNPLGDDIVEDGEYDYPGPNGAEVVPKTIFAKWTLGIDYTFGKHVYLNAQWVHGFPDEFGAGDWITPGYTVRASQIRDGSKFGDCVAITSLSPLTREMDGTKCAQEWYKPRLGDYLVLGLDVNFAAQRGLFRLFTIWDLIGVYESTWDPQANERTVTHHHMFTKEGFSAVIYPDFRWNFGNGFEWHVGALVQLGQPYSKFGAPETGGHQIWTRAKYSF